MKALLSPLRRVGFVLAVLVGTGAPWSAHARDASSDATPADTIRVKGGAITVEVSEDGRIMIDGEVVEEGDGPVVVLFDRGDGVTVVEPGRFLKRRFGTGPPIAFRFKGDLEEEEPWFGDLGERFELEVAPHLEGLLDGTELLRRHFEERDWEEHGEVARMERETRLLARQARRAEGAERERLERELRTQLEDLFDRKMELRRQRADRLAEELDRQQEQLQERQAQRGEIIERRLRSLLGEEEVPEW